MATSYTVTSQTNAVLLDAERRALVPFTVANQTGRPVRARMVVTPFAPTPAEWFWIDPEGDQTNRVRVVERQMPLGGSDTCNVRIGAPPDAGPGPQAFRLDVLSVERPDEEWAHGAAVGFDIPVPAPQPPPPPPGYIESIGGGLAGAVVGIVLGTLTGVVIGVVSGADIGSVLTFGFTTLFGGGLVAAIAFGGAIGIFAALMFRAILRPEPWMTAGVYALLALVVGTLLQFVAAFAAPSPAQAVVMQPVDQIVLQTFIPIITTTFPPTTAQPRTAAPTARPSSPPVVQKPEISPLITVLLSLIGTVLSAAAARAFTRWRALGTL